MSIRSLHTGSPARTAESRVALLLIWLLSTTATSFGAPADLEVGRAGHAFDHLGEIGEQAPAAAASGATIIYPTGVGGLGYSGLPEQSAFDAAKHHSIAYIQRAKQDGLRLAIGYVCATSIVKMDAFDHNWSSEFRSQFKTPVKEWLQQGRDGKPLASWYGGDYRPACMNNPDWREYEKLIVRCQIEAGHDGIFFDNPSVHPDGCYCGHCMTRFAAFLTAEGKPVEATLGNGTASRRQAAIARPGDFLRFRSTIARDFLAEMRTYARTLKPDALVTCNNSLNSPGAFFSQCRTYGYNISELSRVEDFVVVEDMASQPRTLPDGTTVEYGPMYEMIHAIARGKPVVSVTIAEGDYHTPPNLMRLAMAEAAAHGASYLSWPTWPAEVRPRMIAAVRPQADLLRQNASLLNGGRRRADVLYFVPFRKWVQRADCPEVAIAGALGRDNVQFRVVADDLPASLAAAPRGTVLLAATDAFDADEQKGVEQWKAQAGRVVATDVADWMSQLHQNIERPSIVIKGAPAIRAVVHDVGGKSVVHLLNLDIRRVSSFEDVVKPASDVSVEVWTPFAPGRVDAITADSDATARPLTMVRTPEQGGSRITLRIPRVRISTMLVIAPDEGVKP